MSRLEPASDNKNNGFIKNDFTCKTLFWLRAPETQRAGAPTKSGAEYVTEIAANQTRDRVPCLSAALKTPQSHPSNPAPTNPLFMSAT
jgi:hypothetical protein